MNDPLTSSPPELPPFDTVVHVTVPAGVTLLDGHTGRPFEPGVVVPRRVDALLLRRLRDGDLLLAPAPAQAAQAEPPTQPELPAAPNPA